MATGVIVIITSRDGVVQGVGSDFRPDKPGGFTLRTHRNIELPKGRGGKPFGNIVLKRYPRRCRTTTEPPFPAICGTTKAGK